MPSSDSEPVVVFWVKHADEMYAVAAIVEHDNSYYIVMSSEPFGYEIVEDIISLAVISDKPEILSFQLYDTYVAYASSYEIMFRSPPQLDLLCEVIREIITLRTNREVVIEKLKEFKLFEEGVVEIYGVRKKDEGS
jgi:hypothetical protein